MKILESKTVPTSGKASVCFIRIDPEDISATLSDVLKTLMDLSWLTQFDEDYIATSYRQRAQITINDIKAKFAACDNSQLTKDSGEYVVSEISREAIVSNLGYLDIPLAELLGKKKSGNPGFDFHTQNPSTNTVIFGEAKYQSTRSAHLSALTQINKFIATEKDVADIADLQPFCTSQALHRAANGMKGFAAAFSAKRTSSDSLISAIQSRTEYTALLKYDEVILVAVNL